MQFQDIIPPKSTPKHGASKIFRIPAEKDDTRRTIRQLLVLGLFAGLIILAATSLSLFHRGVAVKANVVQEAGHGFEKIIAGGAALADSTFETARRKFEEAAQIFQHIDYQTWFTAPKIPGLELQDPAFVASRALVNSGLYLSEAGMEFTEILPALELTTKQFFELNRDKLREAGASRESLTEKLKEQEPAMRAATERIEKAHAEIAEIPESFVPQELKEKFGIAKDALGSLVAALTRLQEDLPAILTLLGDSEPHTFLVLLQNNAELRPSGGFIGNFLIAETNDGYLVKNEVQDVYSADHELTEVLAPPPEILPVNPRWFLRDSNYSGHFPLSAAKAAWFLEHENGPGVDTVLAVDQTFLTELLRLTGGIKVPELKLPLTSANFSTVISYVVEAKLTGRENPKAILQSFLPAFEARLFSSFEPAQLLPLLQSAIESKHLLGYSRDPAVQTFFERHGMAGEIAETDPKEDYLNIVHTSIGGNKSDQYMEETVTHDTYLHLDGGISDELNIQRRHVWNAETERRLRALLASFGFTDLPRPLIEILGRSRNLHKLRIYVPKGAILESSSDPAITAEFDQEIGKTYFSATAETGVSDTRNLRLRYKLPFRLSLDPVDKYELTVQKQAGQNGVAIIKRVFPDSGVKNYKYFPDSGTFDADGVLNHQNEFTRDMNFTSVWGK